jgi:hypothetical protein
MPFLPRTLAIAMVAPLLACGAAEPRVGGVVVREHVETRPASAGDGVPLREAVLRLPVIDGRDAAVVARIQALNSVDSVFDVSLDELRRDAWLGGIEFRVVHNNEHVLDIEWLMSGAGAYPSEVVRHVVADVGTGRRITAADAFTADGIAVLLERVRACVHGRADEARQHMRDAGEPGLVEEVRPPVVSGGDLDRLSIDSAGVAFLIPFGLPHVLRVFEPDPACHVAWTDLRTHIRSDGPLAFALDPARLP